MLLNGKCAVGVKADVISTSRYVKTAFYENRLLRVTRYRRAVAI